MYKSIICILFFIILSINAEEKRRENLYDPDSLAVIVLLDSNDFSHDIFWDIIWYTIKETVQDTEYRVARLYLEKDSLPTPIFCIPPEIKDLNRLSWLELAYHDLEQVPIEIGDIEWMQVLDFRYNPLKQIPVELAQCSKLRYLGLAHTDITSMPDEFLDLDSLRPCNIAVDTINGNIYPIGVIDLCGLDNFTLTARQKVWAGVADYEEYKQKYCQQSDIVIPDKKHKPVNPSGIAVKITGYSMLLTLEREGLLSLSLFDSRGKKVRAIIDKKVVSKGSLTIQMDRNISAGVYFLRGRFSGVVISRKVIIEGGI